MTPNEIEILLHCHTTPIVHPRVDAPAVNSAIEMFLGCSIITINEVIDADTIYTTTDKGRALVQMLCDVEFPVQVWADDSGKVIKSR